MVAVGFLGLGSMGFTMAMRLVDAGHDVVVWNRSDEPVDRAVARGAKKANTPADALAQGVSFSMFANDQVADTILSAEVLAAGSGGVHANMASISPTMAGALAKRANQAGVAYVASPVLGRPHVAEAGELNILAAGPQEAIDRAQPFFAVMGKKTWRLGDQPDRANLVKIAVNYNIIHAIQALAESVALVERHGVSAEDFVEVVTNTLFTGPVYTGYGRQIATKTYLPQAFSLELGRKDLRLAMDTASATGLTMPTASVLDDLFARALIREDLADLDWAALAEITREQ
jgi:3-hydroxyisobutyrate dehydrogenase-like beta-hydroxyacid dehydrogenase